MSSGVIIVGPPDDEQVVALAAAVRAQDNRVHIHRMGVTDAGRWNWSPDGIFTPDGVCLTEAAGIFVRSIPIQPPALPGEWVRRAGESDWVAGAARFQRIHGFLKSVQLALTERGSDVINPLWGYMYHRAKPAADLALAAAGIPVPRGVATSDPRLVRELIDEVGQVVYKPVAGGGRCRKLDPDRLDDHRVALAAAPCYFQELVRGDNLRIYTLGDDLLAAFIIESNEVDYRGHEKAVRVVSAAADVLDTAVRAAAALGLTFAGTDIKLLPDGGHVVLDVNPSPMFAAMDARAGGLIAAGLATRLIGTGR